ncbi:MAG: cysteine desulfurase NifS [Candidatus Infernicultor aquiphilus]|uniref:Cysteine desulfurase IscS n=1 Tax=Candidatus Infernicultor aquiphilus TaxID=1805029 RepID=A0A1J5H157_9BACT|nr:cysteine desulfurase NifS [bacterium]OIP72872.1 MAG: cysteine desulfurase NifS [Candidatus Atribacteria bacterium CG2_30_33_13]PIU24976.1 MAG: cysteine desulfurase NifS [Candidatus Atribacteria bacterium CG08_land_8_20_14_0_20_33_29]PIW12238.1 MAG: cysteine desulfurase NifS [Candidatus Atribacteria bacterium CG17_big_fil_post_rev_8_21_14_2_50_34_11]PIX33940.1 MAG: cysteine desulfurase NifS [Candidatus Atribacteria bacterium CG_4_8_14_3_um_filter_34_18]PIY31241.1 MAG: cysteine desulfurase Ni
MKRIYMDHAATTSTDVEVVEAMKPYFTQKYGNPNSIHSFGQEAREAVEEAREKIARLIGANPSEIVFTAGGTEADNYAIKGIAWANQKKGNHIITSQIEHHAVLHSCQFLEKHGFKVTYLKVDKYGLIDPEDVKKAITGQTILVTIMHANNEIGTIEPIKEIGKIVKEAGIYFHTDSVQTTGHIPIEVNDLGVDMLSISGHKLYGPKGVGALYLRKGTKIVNLIDGGAQEKNRRAGTENVTGMVGLGKAVELAEKRLAGGEVDKVVKLRDKLITGIMDQIENVRLNGHSTRRLPGNANICFEFIEGESMLLNLDMKGVAASSGSACTSGSLEPSHVLLAIGLPPEIAHGSLRLTLGKDNTEEDIDYVLDILPKIIEKLRALSPFTGSWDGLKKNSVEEK